MPPLSRRFSERVGRRKNLPPRQIIVCLAQRRFEIARAAGGVSFKIERKGRALLVAPKSE
jgi:hypothetical protein